LLSEDVKYIIIYNYIKIEAIMRHIWWLCKNAPVWVFYFYKIFVFGRDEFRSTAFFSFWKHICIRNFKHIFFIKITSEKTLIGIFFMENICFSNNSKLTVLTLQIDLFNWTKGIYCRCCFLNESTINDEWSLKWFVTLINATLLLLCMTCIHKIFQNTFHQIYI
jgi:hypothetical protein